MSAADATISDWLAQLAARQATPGGGAAALAAAIGVAVGAMSAQYTTGKNGSSGKNVVKTNFLGSSPAFIHSPDDDAQAYTALQASWRNDQLSDQERSEQRLQPLRCQRTFWRLVLSTRSPG